MGVSVTTACLITDLKPRAVLG